MEKTGKYQVVYTFGWYLRKFIMDVQEKGAIPIVLSHTPRNKWKDGKIERNTESFGKWTREAAEATGAYFIDLNKISADKLEKKGVKKAATYYNHDHTHSSLKGAHMNAKSIAMGIVLGVLFGKINISFSDSLSFSPGLTGGVLMVALVLSAIGKTGPIIWSMSGPANQLLRQLGLLLFLAEVGTSAGKNLVATFQESGLLMFGVGAAITLVPMLVAAIVGHFVFKISLLDLLGTITGGMTSTPGLAAADSMVDSNIPSVAYATVYPIAMVFLILFIQVIASAVY